MTLDLTGKVFGRLTVLGKGKKRPDIKSTNTAWLCRCACGKYKTILTGSLRRGHTKSCGCLAKELRALNPPRYKDGRKKDPLYEIWRHIKRRCLDPKNPGYSLYGRRGIKLHKNWLDFRVFKEDILNSIGPRPSKKHSLDRINTFKGYLPNNLRWATQSQQQRNKRKTTKKCTSPYKGVFLRSDHRWQAHINPAGKMLSLGVYDTEKEAAEAYNKAALVHFKEFACLNEL